MSAIIEFKNVSKSFGHIEVLHNLSLTIEEKEVVVLIGASGSGKSTMLRCINGLEMITSGELIVDQISLPGQGRMSGKFERKSVWFFSNSTFSRT